MAAFPFLSMCAIMTQKNDTLTQPRFFYHKADLSAEFSCSL